MKSLCHLSFETLTDYQEGRLDAAAEADVRSHLAAGCAACQERLVWLGSFLPALTTAFTEAEPVVPEAALAYARRLARLPVTSPAPKPQPESFPIWLARLLSDSRLVPGLAGTRGVGGHGTRRLYATPEHYVDLWEERESDQTHYLIGQVYPREGGVAILPESVSCLAESGTSARITLEGKEFHLAEMAAGRYAIRLQLDDGEIRLEDVTVGG